MSPDDRQRFMQVGNHFFALLIRKTNNTRTSGQRTYKKIDQPRQIPGDADLPVSVIGPDAARPAAALALYGTLPAGSHSRHQRGFFNGQSPAACGHTRFRPETLRYDDIKRWKVARGLGSLPYQGTKIPQSQRCRVSESPLIINKPAIRRRISGGGIRRATLLPKMTPSAAIGNATIQR